jgi:hypothetical protein
MSKKLTNIMPKVVPILVMLCLATGLIVWLIAGIKQ